nr:hypothetical protein [Neisseria subflava]
MPTQTASTNQATANLRHKASKTIIAANQTHQEGTNGNANESTTPTTQAGNTNRHAMNVFP